MNGCDRMDQMLSYYNTFNRKTIKWWKRMFMWCFEVSQINAYIIFCLTRDDDTNSVPLAKFKQMLEKEMLIEADGIIPPDHKQHRVHLPNIHIGTQQSHLAVYHKDHQNCINCSSPGKRKRTNFISDTCNVYIHPKNCFEQFHSKNKNYSLAIS